MELIGGLGIGRSLNGHLVPRRVETILPGSSRTLPAGRLRPGDLIECAQGGARGSLEVGVPVEAESGASAGSAQRGLGATLSVTRHRDGSVTADCR